MPNVVSVKPNPKKPENAYIRFDDGTEAWCPDTEKAKALVIGQPLPNEWRVDEGDYGPRAFPPSDRKGTPQAAFRNTKEGFLLEQQGYYRKDERMDRRTALMQAVQWHTAAAMEDVTLGDTLDIARKMYEFLRATSGSEVAALGKPATDPGSSSPIARRAATTASPAPHAGTEAGGTAATAAGTSGGLDAHPSPPAAGEPLWHDLYDLVDGEIAAARRAVTKANKRTTPITDENHHEVTEAEIRAAIEMLSEVPV